MGVVHATAAQTPPPTFTDALEVVEAELLVEVPRGAAIDGVEIVEDGAIWPIDRHRAVVSAGAGAEWHLVLWIDAPLTAPERIAAAARALSLRAEVLVGLGTVEVVLADPAPRRILESTRSVARLEQVLLELAENPPGDGLKKRRFAALAEAKALPRTERGGVAERAVQEEITIVRRQVDWLLLELERGCGDRACALLLLSDGWPLAPGEYWRSVLERGAAAPPGDLDRPTAELAQLVAAWRWVVWPVLIDPPAPDRNQSTTRSDLDRWMDTVGSHTGSVGDVVLWRVARSRRDPNRPPPTARELDTLLTLEVAPLRAVATASAGSVLASSAAIDRFADRLEGFRRVWYRPTRNLDGRIREVSLRRRGLLVHELGVPRWSRSGSPELMAELLLRRLLEGEDGFGTLEVGIEGVSGGQLRVSADLPGVDPVELEAAPPRWRVSWLQRGQAARHRLIEPAESPSLELEITIVEPASPVAIVVEELVRRRRGTLRWQPPQ